ncbi:MAG: NAD(P)-dependent oxidoreductase [Chloroflexota bacterium]
MPNYLDTPVLGSTPQAEQGTLTIFVGGEPAAFANGRPTLEVLGKEAHHMGPSGAGTTMKLVANTMLGVGLQALAEAIALGARSGLDLARLLDVLGQTPVVAPVHKAKLQNASRGEYPVTFALRLMYKDFGLILRQAAELSIPMPATAVAQQMCAAEHAAGREEDYSATIRLMESLAGLDV